MSKNTTQLTLSLIATGLTVVRTWRVVLLGLPGCVAIVVVLVGASIALPIAVVVALLVAIVCHCIRRNRNQRSNHSRLQLDLMVEKTFMNLREIWWCIPPFNLINGHFVLLWKTFNHILNLIFMIQIFTE